MLTAWGKHLLPSKMRAVLGKSSLLPRHQVTAQQQIADGGRLVKGSMGAGTTVCLPYRPALSLGGYPGGWQPQPPPRPLPPSCDVFINHRGADTKRTLAALLYDRLVQLNVRPFLDNRSMKPGDKLFETINSAILGCKVGIAIFSPRYMESYFCLHELALMVERQKRVIPIFCDVQPSDLLDLKDGDHPPEDLERFQQALREVKYTVGLTFDSQNGNWSELVSKTSEIVLQSINEDGELKKTGATNWPATPSHEASYD